MVSLAALLAASSLAGPAMSEEGPPFDGTYVFVGGEPQRTAVATAIEGVVTQMSAVLSGLARDRLRARVGVSPRIVFRPDGERVHIEHAPLPPRTVPVDGTPLSMRNLSGDRVTVTYRRSGGSLVEVISQGRSAQTNRYRLSPDGRELTFDAAIRSPLLPGVIRYRLSYRREG
jgi:hypothetical protein